MTGRPSSYTEEIALEICERLAGGESLVAICLDKHIPSRMSVLRWLNSNDHPGFVSEYARAREFQGDYMDDLILSTANACTAETAKVFAGLFNKNVAVLNVFAAVTV